MPYGKNEIKIKQNAVQFAKDMGDKFQEAQANIELGHAYFGVRQEQNAIECYQNAKKIAQERGDKCQVGEAYLGIGHAYIGIGHAYRGVGHHQTAIKYYQKAQEIARERGDEWQEGRAYLGIGHAYRGVGRHLTAIENYQKAQEIAQERRDQWQEGEAYLGTGHAYRGVGHHQIAIKNYQKVQEIAQEQGDKLQKGRAYLGIGHVYCDGGQHQTAIENYQKAQEVAQERGDKRQEGDAYLGIGHAYHDVGQRQTAIEYFQKAKEIAQKRGDKYQEGEAYLEIGNAYRGVVQHETAIEYYQKAKEIAQERGDKWQEREACRGIGHAYRDLGQNQTSNEYFQKASEISLPQGDKQQKTNTFLGLDYDKAKKLPGGPGVEDPDDQDTIVTKRPRRTNETETKVMPRIADPDDQDTFVNETEIMPRIADPDDQDTIITERPRRSNATETEVMPRIADPDDQDTIITERPRRSNETETEVMPRIAGRRKVLWRKISKKHEDKFEKLVNDLETEPEKAIKIGTYSVCLNSDFVIGRGSDGTTVYIGLCDDGMEVAVKELLLDRCKHLGSNEKEILISPTIRKEQHIVNYLFYTDTVNLKNAYLVLDLCEESLKDYVLSTENSRAMLESKGVNFLRQILLGLKALHCGDPEILHRDLKPSNIFVNVEGELVLADFGISRKLKEGQTTYKSVERGTPGWIAVESISTEEDGDCLSREEKVRYKKQSDIQVVGMVLFYILTKGKHPYGNSNKQRYHLSEGNPVDLNKVSDPLAKDLIEWMLQHDLRERPGVEECLKHPYLMSTDEMFHFVTRVGNEREIKTKDVNSVVVKQLNADSSLSKPSWKTKIDTEVMSYVSGHRFYSDGVADLLRFIRNTAEHWGDKTPPTTVQAKVGTPKEYFLNLFPTLPVVLHRIIRKNPGWKQREQLKQSF